MTVEALYLQMMSVYHLHNEDMDGFVEQLEMFTDHAQKLIKIMSSILRLDEETEMFECGDYTYYGITGFCQILLTEKSDAVDRVLPFITEETLHKPIVKEVLTEEDKYSIATYNIYPLYLAIDNDNLSLIQKMIQRGADVNKLAATSLGYTFSCLCYAANKGNIEIAKIFLENGALVNHGCSLPNLAFNGDEEMVRILLEAGEDPNRPGADGETPLYKAMKGGHKNIEKMLLEAGADLQSVKFSEAEEKRKREKKEKEEMEEKERQEKIKREEEEAQERKRKEEAEKKKKEEEKKRKEEEERRKKTEPSTITARSMTSELKEVDESVLNGVS